MNTLPIKTRPAEFTINAVRHNGPALQFHCVNDKVYYVSYGLNPAQIALYHQLRVMLEHDSRGNRRQVVTMLRGAGFQVYEVD